MDSVNYCRTFHYLNGNRLQLQDRGKTDRPIVNGCRRKERRATLAVTGRTLTGLLQARHVGQRAATTLQNPRALQKVKCRKATGPDNIPPWMVNNYAHLLAAPVTAIFNSSLREGKLPDLWKTATVVPVPPVPVQLTLWWKCSTRGARLPTRQILSCECYLLTIAKRLTTSTTNCSLRNSVTWACQHIL